MPSIRLPISTFRTLSLFILFLSAPVVVSASEFKPEQLIANLGFTTPGAATDGREIVLAWLDRDTDEIQIGRWDSDLRPLDGPRAVAHVDSEVALGSKRYRVILRYQSGGYRLVYSALRAGGYEQIHLLCLDKRSLAVTAQYALTQGSWQHTMPDLAFNGRTSMLVYVRSGNFDEDWPRIMAQALDRNGQPRGAAVEVDSGVFRFEYPTLKIVSAGSHYWVAWTQTPLYTGASNVSLRRLSSSGQPHSPVIYCYSAPGRRGSMGELDVSGTSDGSAAVVFTYGTEGWKSRDIFYGAIGAEGTVTALHREISAQAGTLSDPFIVPRAKGNLVLWSSARFGSNTPHYLQGRTVARDGAPTGREQRVHDVSFPCNRGQYLNLGDKTLLVFTGHDPQGFAYQIYGLRLD